MGGVRQWWMRSGFLIAAVTVILTGCNEASPTGPKDPDIDMILTGGDAPRFTGGFTCDSLRAPAGNRLVAALYAEGDQVYRWSGSAWTFVEPSARLYVSRFLKWPVGSHYAGPTWEGPGGSKVIGSVMRRCTPNANAIPWLLLSATPSTSHGIFQGVTYIQRVGTVGGNAPSAAGDSVGAIARVPYSTEYLFYRGR